MEKVTCLIAVVMLFIAGCGGAVQLSPEYAEALQVSAIHVNQLNKRCQDGDELACKEGLTVAAEALNLLVDGYHGRESK